MSTRKPLGVTDPQKDQNIAVRVDNRTALMLRQDMEANGWATRSEYTSMTLAKLCDAFEAGQIGVAEIRVLGRRRGPNATPESEAMWQGHDREVVRRVKLLEEATKLPRHQIGRAAVSWHLSHKDAG